jgi:hypothetical protein
MAKVEEILEEEEPVPPPKINNANLGELKATTDDAINPVRSLAQSQSQSQVFLFPHAAIPPWMLITVLLIRL